MNLRIVIIHELLDGLERCITQLIGHFRVNLLDFLQIIDPNVLISIGLKDITSNFPSLEARCVNKMAILAACAAIGPMIVSTGHSAEITRLDKLVLLEDGLLGRHLIKLSQLNSSLLIHLFELYDLLIGKRNENLRCLPWRLLK